MAFDDSKAVADGNTDADADADVTTDPNPGPEKNWIPKFVEVEKFRWQRGAKVKKERKSGNKLVRVVHKSSAIKMKLLKSTISQV